MATEEPTVAVDANPDPPATEPTEDKPATAKTGKAKKTKEPKAKKPPAPKKPRSRTPSSHPPYEEVHLACHFSDSNWISFVIYLFDYEMGLISNIILDMHNCR